MVNKIVGYNGRVKRIFVTNTLGREKQELQTLLPGQVLVYHCGPTLYWTQHLGNMRAVCVGDIVNRTLQYAGYDTTFVRNYTDVGHLSGDNEGDADQGEDRMTKAARREEKSPQEIASLYRQEFDKDLECLNVLLPDHRPAATEYIPAMINLVQALLDKGYAYQTNLAIYFAIEKKEDYYKLSGYKSGDGESGLGHGDVSDGEKRNPADFALWFFKTGVHQHALQTWPNPFSDLQGFPGWHLECSAMIGELLGLTIDIHLGGIEHISIHHTNEIAQSECAHGVPLARYWLHNEHLEVDGAKMSKSKGTAYSLQEVMAQGYGPLDVRYFFLQAHYRSKQNFTFSALKAARTARLRLQDKLDLLPQGGVVHPAFKEQFEGVLFDDFNVAGALAVISEVLRADIPNQDKRATVLDFDQVLGLKLDQERPLNLPEEVQELVNQRQEARVKGNWEKSDYLREEIAKRGYEVKDAQEGQRLVEK